MESFTDPVEDNSQPAPTQPPAPPASRKWNDRLKTKGEACDARR